MKSVEQSKQISLRDVLLFVVAAFLFLTAGYINTSVNKPKIILSKQDSALNINRDLLLTINLGNKRLLSNLLWIQTLLESDEQQYKKRDLNSWMYLRFLSISLLDPLFYENYLFGGQLLSIVMDDLYGAEDIYARGLVHYPADFELNYHSGFNLYFEMGKFKSGLERLLKVQNHPKSPWTLNLLINKLKFVTGGDYQSALDFLKFTQGITKDPDVKTKISKDIYALEAERDLECLNQRRPNCKRLDANQRPYIYRNGEWITELPFVPYRIHRREGMDKAENEKVEPKPHPEK